MTTEREAFEAALRSKPEALYWNATDAMFWAWCAARSLPATPESDEPDASQHWADLDGMSAYHLIERHAENWWDAGQKMEAWREARTAALSKDAQPSQAEPAALLPQAAPVAWIRFCSDGTYEGPIMDRAMEDVRKRSGAWTPLYARPVEARLTDAKDLRNGLLMAMNHIDQGRPKQARILISGVYAALSSTSQQGDKA